MLDSPDGVCAGQGRFEYPAASVPSNTRRAASRPTTPPSPSGPAVHGAGLTHARHLRDLRPCAALRRWSPRLPEQHWPPAATARTDRGQPRIPGHRGAHQRSQLRLAQVGRLEASPRRSPGLPQQERVWVLRLSARKAGAESATPQRPVPSRAMCGTPPGELVRDAQGTRVDSRSHPAPVAWRGQAWWSSFARSGVSPRAPGRIARGRRPGPGGRRGAHAWPG